MTSYRVTIRDRETQMVVGYYDGSWTTDRGRALSLRSVRSQKPTPPAFASAAPATPTASKSRS